MDGHRLQGHGPAQNARKACRHGLLPSLSTHASLFSFVLVLFVLSATPFGIARGEDASVCAVVKIEISQELTLERQGFDARMLITNGLDTAALNDVAINVTFTDESGQGVLATSDPANTEDSFFIRLDSMDGIADVDGTGVVAPASSAEIHWLIVPAPGAGGQLSSGELYFVGATLSYTVGGEAQTVEVTPDSIYVKPMPLLSFDYFLTTEIYADDAFTAEIEPPRPFTLGVRIGNNGHGVARDVGIDSAQPTIVENEQGLLIGFSILGASVDDAPASPSLLIDFGDIGPEASRVGRWVMETTLSGQFTEFTAEYSHADELGGEVTSLVEDIQTHLLVHDVRVDLPGRDGVRDFLALDEDIYRVYESEGLDTQVEDRSTAATLQPVGTVGTQLAYRLSTAPAAGFIYLKLADPNVGTKAIAGVTRSDGKSIPADNVWLSKTRDANNDWQYFINLFDVDTTGEYTVLMGEAVSGPRPPVLQAVADRTTHEGNPVSFLVEASDPDGTIPRLTATPLPFGATFTDQGDGRGVFGWTPVAGQAGLYAVNFSAFDGALEASRTASLRVNPAWDTDGDGMADDWELAHFQTLDRDGTGDLDGDGRSDLEEYRQQGDPAAAEGPTAPRLKSPLFNTETDARQPVLEVYNAERSGDGPPLTYVFEVYDEVSPESALASAAGVTEGADSTAWTVPRELEDNRWYAWRVRAFDGVLYSAWTEGRLFVNLANDPPSAPLPETPDDGAQVGELRPLLRVFNAQDADGDTLNYVFRVASDVAMSSLVAESPAIPAGEVGLTGWSLEQDLAEGGPHYWQVMVTDEEGAQAVSAVRSFAIDTTNRAPQPPAISAPTDGAEIATPAVDLTIANAADPDGDALSYFFELDTASDFAGPTVSRSGPIPEGAATTAWPVSGLEDNRWYYWRARASDGTAASPWVYGRFFVDAANEAPSVPVPANPGDGSWVQTLRPRLSVYPARDADGDAIAYEFEVYTDPALTGPVASGGSQDPVWVPQEALADNSTYYWRARATDGHGAASAWSAASRFLVNDNGVDDSPSIMFAAPLEPLVVADHVELHWADTDADSDALIALYYDTDAVGEDGVLIAEGIDESADGAADVYHWDIAALADGTYYVYALITDGATTTSAYAPGGVTKGAAGLVVDPLTGETGEGGTTATFRITLESAPSGGVSLELTSSDPSEGTVTPSALNFTPANWATAQTVTVTGVDDDRVDGDVAYAVTVSAAGSQDPNYARLDPLTVSLTNGDDDHAGVVFAPSDGNTTEAGGTTAFAVTLTSEPTAEVNVALSSSDPGEGTPSPLSLRFGPTDWNTAQTVTMTGVDDAVDDGDVAYTLVSAPVASVDPVYDGLDAADIPLVNEDDDEAAVVVSAASGPTSEAGGAAGFTVVLASEPTDVVRIGLSSADAGEGVVTPAELEFLPSTWNIAQPVTVIGTDDFVDDGDVSYTIRTGPVQSDDPLYAVLDPADVSVVNLDDDQAGIEVAPLNIATSETGEADRFTVVLTSEPTALVTVAVQSSDAGEGVASPGQLAFTAADWNVAQTVTVTGADDDIIDGYVAYNVVTQPAVSADPLYNGRDAADVQAVNSDDEPDTIAPVLTRVGPPELYVELGTVYEDLGATAYDVPEGDLTAAIITTNPVDTGTVGDHLVSYVVSDSAGNAAEGVSRLVHVIDENLPPAVELEAEQGHLTRTVVAADGPVTVRAKVTDVNVSDIHRYDWTESNPALVPLSATDAPAFVFDPLMLTEGLYKVRVRVSDSGMPIRSNRAELLLRVVATPPVLGDGDSDGDGPTDALEGYGDVDHDGIPDHRDDRGVPLHRLLSPQVDAAIGHVTTAPHLRLGNGDVAFAVEGRDGPAIQPQEIANFGNGEGAPPEVEATDPAVTAGEFVDMYLDRLSVPGGTVELVAPLVQPLPERTLLRLFDSGRGWRGFVVDGRNTLASAPPQSGICPPPADTTYRMGLNAGDTCLRLMLQDDGPNDLAGRSIYRLRLTGGIAARVEGRTVLVPGMGTPRTEVILIGSGFGDKKGQVKFGVQAAQILSWSDTEVRVRVPNLKQGGYMVSFKPNKGRSTWIEVGEFTVPALQIETVSAVYDGNRVEITGWWFGLKPGGSVRIGDLDIDTILHWTDRRIEIEVPPMAPGAYDVRVNAFHDSDVVEDGFRP